jgi:uncharacterized protein (TIGR02646 family)
MIQLKKIEAPIELTPDVVATLIAEYLADNTKSVWQKAYIKRELLKISYGTYKCAYCECVLNLEGYAEIDHFFPKKHFPSRVVEWLNLLFCCSHCNKHKLSHNTDIEPIIHPIFDNPKDYLILKAYRFKGKNDIGKRTIELLQLNDRDRFSRKRFDVGDAIKHELDDLEVKMNDYLEAPTTIKRSKIITKFRKIMVEGQPNQAYSATVATEILREDSYPFLKNECIKLGAWDNDFQNLENELIRIAFLP